MPNINEVTEHLKQIYMKFQLSNVVLYAKGWYKTTDDMWEDLKEILKLDDYTPYTKSDVFNIIVTRFSESNLEQAKLRDFIFGIHPTQCWQFGYLIKGNQFSNNNENLPEYNLEDATIKYILSCLRFLPSDKWVPTVPKYKKYPKNDKIALKDVIEMFNKNLEN